VLKTFSHSCRFNN